jgi:hypothetical protein
MFDRAPEFAPLVLAAGLAFLVIGATALGQNAAGDDLPKDVKARAESFRSKPLRALVLQAAEKLQGLDVPRQLEGAELVLDLKDPELTVWALTRSQGAFGVAEALQKRKLSFQDAGVLAKAAVLAAPESLNSPDSEGLAAQKARAMRLGALFCKAIGRPLSEPEQYARAEVKKWLLAVTQQAVKAAGGGKEKRLRLELLQAEIEAL